MKPEHRLIGIIGAMDSELETLLAAMTEKKQETLYGLTFTTGTLDGCAVVLVKAGIGKVNAARCTPSNTCLRPTRATAAFPAASCTSARWAAGQASIFCCAAAFPTRTHWRS